MPRTIRDVSENNSPSASSTDPFKILKSQNPEKDELFVVRKRWSIGFRAPKLWTCRPGSYIFKQMLKRCVVYVLWRKTAKFNHNTKSSNGHNLISWISNKDIRANWRQFKPTSRPTNDLHTQIHPSKRRITNISSSFSTYVVETFCRVNKESAANISQLFAQPRD